MAAVSSAFAVDRFGGAAQFLSLGILTIMKIAPSLIGVCILVGLTGCHRSPSAQAIGAAEAAGIKPIALASIAVKYPDLDTSELTFGDIFRETTPSGKQFISVSYIFKAAAPLIQGIKTAL